MKVKLYKPQNSFLQQYIECFYTFRRGPEDENICYLAFPSIFSMVCLNVGEKIEISDGNLTFTHCPDFEVQTTLMCDFKHSNWIRYEGATDEIVIYFKPLGLNAFLEKKLRHYTRATFVEFSPFDDYRSAMKEIFLIDGDEARLQALENYWLSKYRGFEHPFLHPVIDELMREESRGVSISETARKHGVSRPTLIKHFDLHICTTPSQFKKIVRFRNAMKLHRQKISEENLADISYSADYFDQSHMIKDFKSLTRYSPKDFFSKISTFENGYINWLFL